ncbi:hypothetical protein ACG7TL_006978 [Trametes sanguinea]
MANNATSGRFYAFTSNTPAPLPPSAASPDPRYRPDSSGSDSVSDDDQSAIGHSYPVERIPQGQGFLREQFGAQNASGFVHHRADPASATFYAEDTPFVPNVQFQASQPSGFIQATPDVPFASPVDQFNPAMAASMTPTTPYDTPYGHSSGDSSPVGSNGSGRSDGSGHMSGSSVGSVSTGVVGYMQPARGPVYHGHDVFAPQQRVGPPPGFNPEYYPAYDEHRRRVGMEHARFGTDPRQPEYAYYRPRTHTYPPVGVHGMAPGMASPEQVQSSNFSSPETQMFPMRPDGFQYDRGARGDLVIPGQTRIHLPPPNASREVDISFTPEAPTVLRSGDDAVYQTSDDEIRRYLGLGPGEPLSLDALADPPPGQRPGQSIPILSQLAILGSPNKRLTLQEIYVALEHRFEWFRNNRHDKSWQNSIRHNLSLYKCFRRMSKPITEPGKGSYWVVDYSEGPGTKRPRKRKPRSKSDGSQKKGSNDSREEESDPDALDTDETPPSPPLNAYDIPIDPQLQAQSHQVGQGRSRPPPASAARSLVRRGNSPYSQNAQASVHGRQNRTSAQAGQGNTSGTRQPSNSYGGQPAFGRPSMGSVGYGEAMNEQPGVPGRASTSGWPAGPGQAMQAPSLQYLPHPHGFPMAPVLPPPRPQVPSRSHTLPAITNELRNAPGQYNLPPPRQAFEPARDASGRFVSRNASQPQATGALAQRFVEGSSRGGRRTSSSSGSSRE